MEVVRTVRCRLEVNQHEADVLRGTMSRFAAACQDIRQVALEHGTTDKIKLQHLCYREIKHTYGLQANLVSRAIARVAEAVKRKPGKVRPTSASLDQRTFRWIPKKEAVSVSTHAGRLVLKTRIGNYQRHLLAGQKPPSATLVFSPRTGDFYIHIVLSTPVPDPKGSRPVGVDRGLVNLAVLSNGVIFPGRAVLARRRHFRRLREALQRKGTKEAKRLLKRLAGKERRWMRDVNHVVSKRIVEMLEPGDILVLEDLRHIRGRIKASKELRRDLHSWAFWELERFLRYKCALRGHPVLDSDPTHTSDTCPRCGHCEKANRPTRSLFHCRKCGFQHNADVVAAINVARRAGSPAVGLRQQALKTRRLMLQGTA